jgi:hypothetical protein
MDSDEGKITACGRELLRLRTERKLTLGEVARRVSCSTSYLSNVSYGRADLTPRIAGQLDYWRRALIRIVRYSRSGTCEGLQLGSENSKPGFCAFTVLPRLHSAACRHRTEDGVPPQDERRAGARQDGHRAASVRRPARYIKTSYKCCML